MVDAGHLRGLTAQQRAAGHPAGFGHAAYDVRDQVGVDLARRDVVEEEQRAGGLHEHVVDAVVDDVGADTPDAAQPSGELDLRADAVGRGDEHRIVERLDRCAREDTTEAAEAVQHAVVVGRPDSGGHLVDRPRPLVDVDPGGGVGGDRGPGRPPGDVAAELHPLEADVAEPLVGDAPGLGEVAAQSGNRQDAPTRDRAVAHAGIEPDRLASTGSGVVDRRAVDSRVGDRGALRRAVRIARGGGDNRYRRTVSDPQRLGRMVAARAGQRECSEVGVEQREHGLGLGIAEAHVVLDQPGSVARDHQPGEDDTDVRRARPGEVVEHRLHERREQPFGREGDGCRCVRAHPAGVRPGVALTDPFVILRERESDSARSVAQREQ